MQNAKKPQAFHLPDKHLVPLFVYATLMHPKSQEYVVGHKEQSSKVFLPHYCRVPFKTPEGKEFFTLKADPSAYRLRGDLLMVSSGDLVKLKHWEDQYHLIPVILENGQKAQAFILNKPDELKQEKP